MERRRKIARYYIENISNEVILPEFNNGASHNGSAKTAEDDLSHVWHLFVIRSGYREHLQQAMSESGIQTLIHYPVPPHQQKAYSQWNNLSLPVTEKIHREVLSLPISPVLTAEEADRVVNVVNLCLKKQTTH